MSTSPRIVAVCQQPNYFPWLGYLEQCARADRLIFLDSVQWLRQGRQHRAKVLDLPRSRAQDSKPAAPAFTWLTLPVLGHGHRERPLGVLELAPLPWARKHWATLQAIYARRPYFKTQLEPIVRPWLEKQASERLMSEVASSSVRLCLEHLGYRPEILRSSELPERGRSTERLVSLCQAVGATAYYSGLGSTYIETERFREAGLELVWQRWRHPEYEQGRAERRTHLSVLDALANVPLDELRAWLAPKKLL